MWFSKKNLNNFFNISIPHKKSIIQNIFYLNLFKLLIVFLILFPNSPVSFCFSKKSYEFSKFYSFSSQSRFNSFAHSHLSFYIYFSLWYHKIWYSLDEDLNEIGNSDRKSSTFYNYNGLVRCSFLHPITLVI